MDWPVIHNEWSLSAQHSTNNPEQFVSNIIYGKDLQLVDGGEQRRSFTYIADGISALMRIIENKDGCADSKIFNIGNPTNNASIKEIAEKILTIAKNHPQTKDRAKKIKIVNTNSSQYYGKGYQDMQNRVPAIKRAQEILGWQPTTTLDQALKLTADYYFKDTGL